MNNETALPAQLRFAAEIIEKNLPYFQRNKDHPRWHGPIAANVGAANAVLAGDIISLAQPATKASDGPAVPEGFHLATEEEMKKLPEGSMFYVPNTRKWKVSERIGAQGVPLTYACPNTPEPTRQQQQLKELRQVVLDASEPEWITHDGGPCPLVDSEVENWEYQMRNGTIHKSAKKPSGASWERMGREHECDIIAYRVTKRREPTTLKDVTHLATINAPKFQEVEKEPPGESLGQICQMATNPLIPYSDLTASVKAMWNLRAQAVATAATAQLRAEVERLHGLNLELHGYLESAIVQLNLEGTTAANLAEQINFKIMQRDEWHRASIARAEAAEAKVAELEQRDAQWKTKWEATVDNLSLAVQRSAELERQLTEVKKEASHQTDMACQAIVCGQAQEDPHADDQDKHTFEAHGFTWTKHTPGDPMPCGQFESIWVILRGDLKNNVKPSRLGEGGRWFWGVATVDPENKIIGWRYADKPETEVKPAPFNESKWIWKMEWCRKQGRDASNHAAWTEAEKQFNAKEESK